MAGRTAALPAGSVPALILALGASLGLLAAFHDRFWYPPDEGNYAHVAERVLDGEVLNRDVQDVHAGYVNFLNAAALAAFGRRLLSLRYPLAAAGLAAAVLGFALLVRRGPSLAAAGSLAATALGVLQFLNPSAHWYCLPLFFATALALERLAPEAGRRAVIAGLLVGLTFGFRQLTGVLVALGVTAYLLLEAGDREPGSRRETLLSRAVLGVLAGGLVLYLARATNPAGFALFGLSPLVLLLLAQARPLPANRAAGRTLLRLAAGGLAALLPLVLYHLLNGSLASWCADAVGAAGSLGELPFIRSVDLASTLVADGLGVALQLRSVDSVASGLLWALLPLLACALGLALVLRALPHRGKPGPPPLLPFLAAFYAVVTVHFQNSTYLFFGLPPTVAGLLWLGGEARPALRRGMAAAALALSAVAVYFHAGQTTNRDYPAFLTGERVPVVEAAGLARCGLRIDARDLAEYRAALTLIEAETSPGEEIFAVPSNAELYFLSGRRNPFRFFNFALGVKRETEARALLERLASRPPRLVFYDGLDKYNTPLSRWTMVQISRRYELLGAVGRWSVFRLPPGGATAPRPGTGGPR